MALTTFQRHVCRLPADRRRRSGDSYVAGGVALSVALETARLSRDVDIFHDTAEAVAASWDADRTTLVEHGYTVVPLREVRLEPTPRARRRGLTVPTPMMLPGGSSELPPERRNHPVSWSGGTVHFQG